MKHRLSLLIYATVASAASLIFGCADKPKLVSDQLKSWHEIQDSYAAVIAATGRLGESTSIVPVKDFVFPIGTPLNSDTSMPRTTRCQVPKEAVLTGPFATLPTISSTTSWGALAAARTGFNTGIGDLGVDLQQARNIHLAYLDLRFDLIPDVGVDEYYRQSAKCLSDIDGRTISIVRGYIYGRLRIKSSEFDKASAKARVKKVGGLDVRYTDGGEISIDDDQIKPRFVILSKSVVSSKCPTCPIGVAQLSPAERDQAAVILANQELALSAYHALAVKDLEELRHEMQARDAQQRLREEMQAQRERSEAESKQAAGKSDRRQAPAISVTP